MNGQQPQPQGPVRKEWNQIIKEGEIIISNLEKELIAQRAVLASACEAVKEESAPKEPSGKKK